MSFRVRHDEAFCNICEQVEKWSDQWEHYEPGSRYFPSGEPGGIEFSIYVCPSCVRGLSRDAKRETRFASYDEVEQLREEFWLAEIEYAKRYAKQLWDKWEASQQQLNNVLLPPPPPPPPPEHICVPDDDNMEL